MKDKHKLTKKIEIKISDKRVKNQIKNLAD